MSSARLEHGPLEELASVPFLEGLLRIAPGVVVLDASGRIAWISEALGGGGENARAFLGRDWRDFVRDREAAERLWQRIGREGGVWNESVEVETPDGHALAIETHALRVCPERKDGAVVALVRRRRDGERHAEEFRRTVEYLSAILDSSPDPVIVADCSGRIQYANSAVRVVLGWRPEQVVGRLAEEFLATAQDAVHFRRLLEPRNPVLRAEIEVRHGDGSTRWSSVSASALRLRGGSVGGVVAFVRDETDRRSFKRSLERKNAELEQTVRAVSHDLRAPLVSVLGFSRLLRDDYGSSVDEKGRHFLQRIEEAGRTMEGLIRELLDFSRIGHQVAQNDFVDPREVLQQLRAELKTGLDEQGVCLELPVEPPLVRCERTRLYQVFSNLIGNALQHMGACTEPRIVVEVVEEPEAWRLSVRDNGRGVDPSHHERIFGMFETLPHAGAVKGNGIGLAIVKKIAEVHGGRAWVESRPGEGAAFHVTLARR